MLTLLFQGLGPSGLLGLIGSFHDSFDLRSLAVFVSVGRTPESLEICVFRDLRFRFLYAFPSDNVKPGP